ncbi:MAG: single-stranded-DNA-specific exonuclease RecJ [Candidatus Cardinium sp.]|uniref:single-stranded-DNA-specific exonuclease RecJ n=1 Tax=Cardinium endosymbiont of Dermatophagoides farinae TaxID=2597823 RepID=UPI00118393DE|nr:single-stranded-DNA-specific exonuclease RecJ [Cardinium endosymbiont of Dermatophagoides farinae]TSJ81434.1 single-stranded-DNA-specific exonuclease RecJ [Cardinium endosymbiont of Dermatophagoides farinae]UWW97497.1 MAG: single-stranded-DNA-specific exonuclease RecJ [Candidatus Cardinium sp.]
MHKRWVIQSFKEPDKVAGLEKVLGTPAAISSILVHRAIETFETAKHFFRPSLAQLCDPFLMQGMAQAVTRLRQALSKKEKILIYGDYDVDGTTAVAMVYDFLQSLPGATVSYYVPDRMREGYGVSMQAIEKAYQEGIQLIITLDCGIKAYASIAQAVERGIDVIVCDHHEVGAVLPPAYAILDPRQPSCPYPFKELSGCGIGFKLLQAFCKQCGLNPEIPYSYLDLVAVSTACDIVPLVDENRILAYYGIKQLEAKPRPGLQALMELGRFAATITISDIVFKIGPRINAAGRMSHAALAVQLLVEKDIVKAYHLAQSIDQQNLLRQSLDHTITQEALAMIENRPQQSKSNVLFNPDWHKGIIGIVASRCIEQWYRPTVILTLSDGQATGSARSIPGYNIYEAISACSPLLHQYGGHAFAAGLTMPLAHMARFQKKFEEVVSETITDDLLIPQQTIHALIPFQAITQKFVNILMQMAPFGPGNATPVFASEKVYARKFHLIKERHLKLELYQIDCMQSYEAIGFDLGGYLPLVSSGQPFAIAYTIGYNYYLGNKSLQLIVKDIKKGACVG